MTYFRPLMPPMAWKAAFRLAFLRQEFACAAIVGNEDGAHPCSAEMFQALNDVGFTIPANGMTYWVGEAMGDTDYKDLKKPFKATANATQMMVRNAVHLAKLLSAANYPGKA